jgi:hypothetical protein
MRADRRVGHDLVDLVGLRALHVHGDRGGEQLDVAHLLGAGRDEHVAVLGRAAVPPALEEVLRHDAQLALGPADGLLEHAREDRVGLVDPHGVRQVAMMEEHGFGLA